jgi:hypothetical protein
MATKIKVYARTNMNGSDVNDEYDAPENWDQMSEEERQAFLTEAAEAHLGNCVDYGAYAEEE